MAHDYIKCRKCGKTEDFALYRNFRHPLVETMRRECNCFDCVYWSNWLNNPEPNTITINGNLYLATAPIEQPTGLHINQSKLKFFIDPSNREGYATVGLVLRGQIPSQFREAIPDQFKFISRQDYKALIQFDAEMCLSKGCFDRYNCLWYRADIAEPDEPWNTIPKNYHVGSENCPSFINKNSIYDNH